MLRSEPDVDPDGSSVSIFAVIVLYKLTPAESSSYRTLLSAFARVPANSIRFQVLLYDNTPAASRPDGLPEFVTYVSSPVNTGVATAYNLAADMAAEQNFAWLLTLDQDTVLPDIFLVQLAPVIQEQQKIAQVAAIVPHIGSGTRALSPYWLWSHFKPRWFAKGFYGIPDEAVYAINSGALIRVAALQQVGGYSRLFWLDASDFYLFRRLERMGSKVFVAGTVSLQHDLSLNDAENKMSLSRFANALAAGSALFDMEFGRTAGFGHTLLLFHLYYRQWRNRQAIEARRLTLSLINKRLFRSRTWRLQSWLASQEERIASWQEKIDPSSYR